MSILSLWCPADSMIYSLWQCHPYLNANVSFHSETSGQVALTVSVKWVKLKSVQWIQTSALWWPIGSFPSLSRSDMQFWNKLFFIVVLNIYWRLFTSHKAVFSSTLMQLFFVYLSEKHARFFAVQKSKSGLRIFSRKGDFYQLVACCLPRRYCFSW